MNIENSVKQAILGLLIDFLLLFLFSVFMKVYFEREIYQCKYSKYSNHIEELIDETLLIWSTMYCTVSTSEILYSRMVMLNLLMK